MSAQVDALIAELRAQRASSQNEPVICIYDTLIAALAALDAGAGTVTSVGLALDSGLYTVSGSPVLGAGTLTGTLNTQTANTIYAGPTTGAAAKPAFRALVAADLNALALTAGSVLFANSSGGIGQNNTRFFWDDTNFRLIFGAQRTNTDGVVFINNTGLDQIAAAVVSTAGTHTINATPVVDGYATGASFLGRRAQGTVAVPTGPTAGQNLCILEGQGYDGTAFGTGGRVAIVAAEPFASGARGATCNIQLVTVGTTTLTTKFSVGNDARYNTLGAQVDAAYSKQVPASGATINAGNTVSRLILAPAGALAALTINFPATPSDGQKFGITSTQTVAALTLAAAGATISGPLTAFTAVGTFGSFAQWQYVTADLTWYRVS